MRGVVWFLFLISYAHLLKRKRPIDNKKEQRTQHATQWQFVFCGGRNRPSSIYRSGCKGLMDQSVTLTRRKLGSPPHTDAIELHIYCSKNFYEEVDINFTEFIRFVKGLSGFLMRWLHRNLPDWSYSRLTPKSVHIPRPWRLNSCVFLHSSRRYRATIAMKLTRISADKTDDANISM